MEKTQNFDRRIFNFALYGYESYDNEFINEKEKEKYLEQSENEKSAYENKYSKLKIIKISKLAESESNNAIVNIIFKKNLGNNYNSYLFISKKKYLHIHKCIEKDCFYKNMFFPSQMKNDIYFNENCDDNSSINNAFRNSFQFIGSNNKNSIKDTGNYNNNYNDTNNISLINEYIKSPKSEFSNNIYTPNNFKIENNNINNNYLEENKSNKDNNEEENEVENDSEEEDKEFNGVYNFEKFDSLEELKFSLKEGQKLCNYIKSRKNTLVMLDLLKKLNESEITEIIEIIKPKLKDLMMNNKKLCEKLFELCNPSQRIIILKALKNNFLKVSANRWGSSSIQTLLKLISLPEEKKILESYRDENLLLLATEKHGNYVLHKVISIVNDTCSFLIIKDILSNFNNLISNPHGLNLLKNLVYTIKSSEIKKMYMEKVVNFLPELLSNYVGFNLVLQITKKWEFGIFRAMMIKILENLDKYIFFKYTGNLILSNLKISLERLPNVINHLILNSNKIKIILTNFNGIEITRQILINIPNENEKTEILKKLPLDFQLIFSKSI